MSLKAVQVKKQVVDFSSRFPQLWDEQRNSIDVL